MKYYRITAKLLSPFVIRQNRQSSTSQSITYLPGSSFRGAVAGQFFRKGGSAEDKDFQSLFVENPVSFPNLLPAKDDMTLPQVLPMTCVSCKRYEGFKTQHGHGVSDRLALTLINRNQEMFSEDEFSCCKHVIRRNGKNKECRNELKSFTGFWNGNIQSPYRFQPSMFFQRHTGIDRTTGTIALSMFFISQAMADYYKDPDSGEYYEQYLSGSVFLSDEQEKILMPMIEEPLFAGAERTRGMGEIELSVEEIPVPEIDLEKWNKDFKEKISFLMQGEQQQELLSGFYFSIKLESDAILADKFLRPTAEIEIPFDNVSPVLKVAKSQIIRGWNSAWRLPKPDDTGVMMGSVYLFRHTGENIDGLKQFLEKLAITGIGLRREEGFGRISICDSVHTLQEVI